MKNEEIKEEGAPSSTLLELQDKFDNIFELANLEKGDPGKEEGTNVPLLKSVSFKCIVTMDVPVQEWILSPLIAKQGLVMLYAYRGIGKTFVSLGIAYAASVGGSFLKWKATRPHKVLFIDGEMPLFAIQERLRDMAKANQGILPERENFHLITPDLQERGIPSLHTKEGQEALEPFIEEVDLVVIDNISTLCRGGKENEADSWLPIQEWALSLRRRNVSVLFVHHSGKQEQQRGTSRREDVLDTVISLKRPSNYKSREGARFEVHYEKTRYIFGEEAEPFEAQLEISDDGKSHWKVTDVKDELFDEIIQLTKKGRSQREIAQELGKGNGTIHRLQTKAKEQGLI